MCCRLGVDDGRQVANLPHGEGLNLVMLKRSGSFYTVSINFLLLSCSILISDLTESLRC